MSLADACGRPGKPVTCGHCGYEFPQDPIYAVVCPDCKATPGHYCQRPSGHSGPFIDPHAIRDLEAVARGHWDHKMPGTDEWCPNGIHSWETDRIIAAANKWKINPQHLSIKQVPGQPTPPPPPPEPKPKPAPEPPAEPDPEQLVLF